MSVHIVHWICAVADGFDEGNPVRMIRVEVPLVRWKTRVVVPRDRVEGRVLTKGLVQRKAEPGGNPVREGPLKLKE